MAKEKRLDFIETVPACVFVIYNNTNEELGTIEKCRVGSYMHWCFCPKANMQFSAGCMDEIRECMKNPVKYTSK